MAQVKKREVREAILAAAFQLFSRQGYQKTTLSQISHRAGVSAANVYVYFGSKLEVLYAIYDPWLRQRLERLERELARLRGPGPRLKRLVSALWRDIPAERNGFANNVMQAVSTATPEEGYNPALLDWVESKIASMIRGALPPRRGAPLGTPHLSHILMMAFDGFVIAHHLRSGKGCSEETVDLMCALILGKRPAPGQPLPPRVRPGLKSRPR